jgi:hypothetical protein
MSNEDLKPNLTDAVWWDSGMANAQTLWEDVPVAERGVREHVDVTAQVAGADQGQRIDEIGSVSWGRSGLLRRLRRRPRPHVSEPRRL